MKEKELKEVTINNNTGKVVTMKEKNKIDKSKDLDDNEDKDLDYIKDDNEDKEDNFISTNIDDFELDEEKNPYIDDFTNQGGSPPVTSIQVNEEDKLRVLVIQLQIQSFELESQILEQKHLRKSEELSRIIEKYKEKYEVPLEWKLHGPTGTFNKAQ